MKGKDYAKIVNNGLSFCQGMIYLGIMKALWFGWKWYIVGCAKKYCDFGQLDDIHVEMG